MELPAAKNGGIRSKVQGRSKRRKQVSASSVPSRYQKKYFSAEAVARSLNFGSPTSTSSSETTKNGTAAVSKRTGVSNVSHYSNVNHRGHPQFYQAKATNV